MKLGADKKQNSFKNFFAPALRPLPFAVKRLVDFVMAKLLLHVCCGPCTTATLEWMRSEVAKEVTGFFYNPNIHPEAEYLLRRGAMAKVGEVMELPLVWAGEEQRLAEYLHAVVFGELSRCQTCYMMRLAQAAQQAAANNYDAFSTTLLISPYQNLDVIKIIGEALSKQWGPDFIFRDLRHIFPRSRQLAKEWGLYRQKYCGCVFSEMEREKKKSQRLSVLESQGRETEL